MAATNGASTNGHAANGHVEALDWSAFTNTVNNKPAQTAKTRHGINPWTEEALPEVPVSTQADVDEAVQYARAAFTSWRKTTHEERSALVLAYAAAIEAHSADIQAWLVRESGKPVGTAAMEFGVALQLLRGFAGLKIDEEVLEDTDERRAVLRYVPLGVGVAIVPWNWPLVLAVGKIGPALLTGNTLIVKPSPFTPYVDLKLGEIGAKVFPPGVLQVLSGGDDLGPMLTEHAGVDKVAFTGSTATGMKVMKSCAGTLKRFTLELGGNDAAIICDDIDIAKVVPKIATFAFLSSGQICMDVKRVYVDENIYDQFKQALVEFVKSLPQGTSDQQDSFIGPVQNKMQYDKVLDMYSQINRQGWDMALGGAPSATSGKGYFFNAAVVDNPPEKSRIVEEEPFGPIVPLLKWSNEDDVIRRANDTKMGLGASVWTRDLERGARIQSQLEAGSTWVNTHFELAPHVPFGGHKWSGIGMEWGVVGFKNWCNAQSVWTRKDLFAES